MSIEDDTPRKRRGPVIAASVFGGVIVLAGGLYVGAYAMAGDNTPKNASVNGVAIGSMSAEQAVATLKKELDPKVTAPITISAGGKTATISPAEAGMTVDYEATVRQAGAGKSWSPGHIVNVLRGGSDLKLATTIDDAKLTTAVTGVSPTFATEPKNAALVLKDGKPVVTEGTDGSALDVGPTVTAVSTAWSNNATTAQAAVTAKAPDLTTDEANAAVKNKITPLLSAPVTVQTSDSKSFELPVSVIAAATTVKAENSDFTVSTDMKKVWEGAQKTVDSLKYPKGKDASFSMASGKPTVVPSVDGTGIAEADFIKSVQPALTKTGAERVAKVTVQKTPAEFSTEDANKLGVTEVTGEFTTQFPYAEYRNVNLSRAAASLNGTLIKPGETFSLNNTLGERTNANGYIDGYVINGGVLVKETGGGVSQSATTTFNAAFFAGLEDVEHHPHTLYFPRYPAGREATVYYGQLDLRFKNNTPYGVVIQAYVNKAAPGGQGSITVKMWSTKVWDKVESSALNKSNFTSGRTITSDKPNCEYQAPIQGFDVNYQRLFYKNGAVAKTENFKWTYSPGDEIRCG